MNLSDALPLIENNGLRSLQTRRRWLVAGAAWPALAWMGALRAQPNPPLLIGWLLPGSRDARGPRAFNESMAALGWKVDTHYVLEERWAEGRAERLPVLAQEIAEKKPAVIMAYTSVAARAASAAAPTTPIVLTGGDPVSTGLVTSLARPGGMITGLSNVSSELNVKLVELLVEAVPKLKRVGFLMDSSSATGAARVESARSVAEHFRLQAVPAMVARPEAIEPALARLAQEKVQALVLLPSVWIGEFHPKIIAFALTKRWPVAGIGSGTPRLGGLFSYGPSILSQVRRSASYVDRILKGAKPGDLPIELPTAFDLILNMKTAKQLGITIPTSMRLRATEVIE